MLRNGRTRGSARKPAVAAEAVRRVGEAPHRREADQGRMDPLDGQLAVPRGVDRLPPLAEAHPATQSNPSSRPPMYRGMQSGSSFSLPSMWTTPRYPFSIAKARRSRNWALIRPGPVLRMMQVTPSSRINSVSVQPSSLPPSQMITSGGSAAWRHDGELTLDPFALVEDRDHDGILVGPGPELLDGRGGELPIGGGLERVEIIHKARVPRERAAARTSRGTDGRPMWTGHRSRRPAGRRPAGRPRRGPAQVSSAGSPGATGEWLTTLRRSACIQSTRLFDSSRTW